MSAGLKPWKPYPAYKDSGVEWLGQVPEGWENWKLSHAFGVIGSGTTPKSDNTLYYDGSIPWVTTAELREGIVSETKSTVSDVALAENSALKIYPKGTLLVAMYGATIGRMGLLDIEAACNQACCALAYGVSLSPNFLFFWLQGMRNVLLAFAAGGGQPNLSQEFIKNIIVAAPAMKEQGLIIQFLDQQCAQIDSLIEKKQRMVDLLDEKRRAVITQAVTRGLDPTVPMKDSGVEWLGMVPKGWEIKRLGVISQFIQTGPFGSQLHSEDYIESGTPVINPSHIQNGKIVPDYRCSIDKYNEIRLHRHKLTVGDVVFARRGEMGRCAEILSGDDGYICGTGCLQIRFKDNALSAFFASYLQTEFIRDYLKLESVGSTMDNLNTEILSKIPIPLPHLPEQQAIADYLDAQCATMDSQRKNLEKSIELLREYRASLITHAVTGKIDVREVAPLQ